MPAPHRPAVDARRPVSALALLVAAAVLGRAASAGGAALGAPAARARQAATATPTLEAWTPGGTWAALHAPGVAPLWPGANVAALRAVHGLARPDGSWEAWAGGEQCLLAHFDGAAWSADASLAGLCTPSRRYDVRDLFVKAPDEVWAVGRLADDRDCVAATPTGSSDVGYEEGCGFVARYDGTAWRVLAPSEVGVPGRLAPLNGLDMVYDPARGEWVGWAVGNDADFDNFKVLILNYVPGQPGWDDQYTNTNLIADLRDVKVHSHEEAWAVGENGTESYFLRNSRGEAIWKRNGLAGAEHLYMVDMTDPQYGWDGGWKGRMHHYDGNCHDDDATTPCWFDNADRPVFDENRVAVTNELYGIDLLRRGVGWLVGSRGSGTSLVAYLSVDHWYTARVADDPVVDLYGVFMRDERHGWAVGDKGTILAYQDVVAPTAAATGTATATVTEDASPTAPPTGTATPEVDETATPTDAATAPEPDTPTPTPTATATATPTPTPTTTESATATRPSPILHRAFIPLAQRPR